MTLLNALLLPVRQAYLFGTRKVEELLVACTYVARLLSSLAHSRLFAYTPEV